MRPKRTKLITYVMDKLKITDVSDRLIKNLSKGYKQRVEEMEKLIPTVDLIVWDDIGVTKNL